MAMAFQDPRLEATDERTTLKGGATQNSQSEREKPPKGGPPASADGQVAGGSEVSYIVFVVLTTSNEKGSRTVSVIKG